MPFAQLVIGPPGSGKSTYCDGMQQLLTALDRKCSVVNLDPANDRTSYPAALDIRDLVPLDEVMEAEELGPNGGILYALEELEHNIEWLEDGLSKLGDNYVLFDCPGQVELFTHHTSLRNIFFRLQKLGYRLVVLHLIDSYSLTMPTLYISTLLLSLRSMLQMDLPHLNVLTKIDNLASYAPLPLPLSFYTEARSLEYIIPHLEQEQGPQTSQKFTKLNEAIIELVDEYGLVGYETLSVEDRSSMLELLRTIDRAGGAAFGASDGVNESVWQVAVREGGAPGKMEVRDIEERWIDRREEFDDLERRMWEAEGTAEKRQVDVGGSGSSSTETRKDRGASGHDDDDSDDLDISSQAQTMAAAKDSGIKVIRKGVSQ